MNHGNRISDWLTKDNIELYDEEVINLVQKMISGLKPIFVRDVAKICKSHNEDDISDFDKYYKCRLWYEPTGKRKCILCCIDA